VGNTALVTGYGECLECRKQVAYEIWSGNDGTHTDDLLSRSSHNCCGKRNTSRFDKTTTSGHSDFGLHDCKNLAQGLLEQLQSVLGGQLVDVKLKLERTSGSGSRGGSRGRGRSGRRSGTDMGIAKTRLGGGTFFSAVGIWTQNNDVTGRETLAARYGA